MAISLVGTSTGSADSGVGTFSVNLPASLQEDDLVIVMMATDSNLNNDPMITTSGYTEINRRAFNDPGGEVRYKIMGATPDSTVSVEKDDEGVVVLCRAYRGVDTATPQDVTRTRTSGIGSSPDPASITTVTDDAVVVALVSMGDDSATSVTPPTGYGNANFATHTFGIDGSERASVGIADKTVATAGAENPGTFSFGGFDDHWRAVTVALRPAVPVDELLANDVNSTSDVSGSAIGQEHGLTANDAQSTSQVTSPALGQAHGLAAADTESASLITSPAIGQAHVLDAADIQGASEVGGPALGQVHSLAANDIQSAGEAGGPALGQTHGLGASDVQSAGEAGSPSIGQVHGLAANDVGSTSEVPSPALGQGHGLSPTSAQSTSELTAPTLAEAGAGTDALSADDVVAAAQVSQPGLGVADRAAGGSALATRKAELETRLLKAVRREAIRREIGRQRMATVTDRKQTHERDTEQDEASKQTRTPVPALIGDRPREGHLAMRQPLRTHVDELERIARAHDRARDDRMRARALSGFAALMERRARDREAATVLLLAA